MANRGDGGPTRWMREGQRLMAGQRPVRRNGRLRMSVRGRVTVFALAGVVAFLGGYALHPWVAGGPGEARSSSPRAEGASVASAPAPEEQAPRWLVERLPVGVLDHGRADVEMLPVASAPRDPITHTVKGYRVDYSFDRPLTGRVMKHLKRGRVKKGHVIVLDPRSGRVLAYVSTDVETFPPGDHYPAASLVKIVTAAAALRHSPSDARRPCLYRGNRYRLTPSRVKRPRRGHEASLERALATSNNQCFAQLAVESLGHQTLVSAIQGFGWLDSPAPGHAAGSIDPGDDDYDLGRLGCGLRGCRITPLHAAQLAATLATGEQRTPWWVDRVEDESGQVLALPTQPEPRRVMDPELAQELRSMLVRTTTHGTARSAFRDRRGRPKLRDVRVAGKTGNLSGRSPSGRYEWFVGVAPAEEPTIAVAVLQLQGHLWWAKSSEIAANVLEEIFCERGRCSAEQAERFTGHLGDAVTPVLLSGDDAGRAPEALDGASAGG